MVKFREILEGKEKVIGKKPKFWYFNWSEVGQETFFEMPFRNKIPLEKDVRKAVEKELREVDISSYYDSIDCNEYSSAEEAIEDILNKSWEIRITLDDTEYSEAEWEYLTNMFGEERLDDLIYTGYNVYVDGYVWGKSKVRQFVKKKCSDLG